MTEHFRLLIFSKPPVHGRVKTRMQPGHSPAQSVTLHRQLLEHALHNANRSDAIQTSLWTVQANSRYLKMLARRCGTGLQMQQGRNLGQRMQHAINSTRFRYPQRVLLIGADCPFITPDYLHQANMALQHQPFVIGPANDGGFILIGASRPLPPRCLDTIDWGTDRVLEQTLAKMKKASAGCHLLPALDDIDRPEDLDLLDWRALHRMRWLFGVQ